eukprot:7727222-Pyramimonas_sp.AAC.1
MENALVEKEAAVGQALDILIKRVRSNVEKVAPLQKHKAFLDYFRRGHRKPGEPDAREKLRDLTNGRAQVSADLRTFFLLDMRSITETQHKTFLGQAQNDYDWGAMRDILEARPDSIGARGGRDHGRDGGGRRF